MHVHKSPGELCNFYIFTDSQCYFMHGGDHDTTNNLTSCHSHVYFSSARLRIDGSTWKPTTECDRWTDKGLHLGVLELYSIIASGLRRIGSDRDCHHYCGTIAELMVYDCTLNDQELKRIEEYLMDKYYIRKVDN